MRINKKDAFASVISFLALMLIFVQCKKNDINIENSNPQTQHRITTPGAANKIASTLGVQLMKSNSILKSATTTKRTIERTDAVTEGKDTLLYVINFADKMGFVITTADKSTFSILAYSETGNFYPDQLEGSAAALWLEAQRSAAKEKLKNPVDQSDSSYQIWKALEASDSDTTYEVSFTVGDNKLKSAALWQKADIPPMCLFSNWGQGLGYNYYCPLVPNNSGKMVKAVVGCGAVATGIVIYKFLYPTRWNFPSMFSGPVVYDQYDNTPFDAPNPLARMLADIGQQLNMEYGAYRSASEPYGIIAAFKKFGYNSPGTIIDYDFNQVYNSLANGSPVILTAFKDVSDSQPYIKKHGWVTDGYHFATIHVTITKKIFGIVVKRTEYDRYEDWLHMNWGQNNFPRNDWYNETNWDGWNNSKEAIINIHP